MVRRGRLCHRAGMVRRYIGIHVAVALATACEYNDTRGPDTEGASGGASSSDTGDEPGPAAVTDASTGPTSGAGGSQGTATSDTTGDGDDDWPDGGWDDGAHEEECDDVLPPKQLAPADDDDECNVEEEYRLCHEQPGTQFCEQTQEGWKWGPCLETYDCIPGDYSVCIYCDEQFGTILNYCYLDQGVPDIADSCDTPLVLRLDGRAVEFTASTDRFTMARDAGCGATDWPGAATPCGPCGTPASPRWRRSSACWGPSWVSTTRSLASRPPARSASTRWRDRWARRWS